MHISLPTMHANITSGLLVESRQAGRQHAACRERVMSLAIPPTAILRCTYREAAWCLQGGRAVSCEHSACPPAQPMDHFPHDLGDVKPLGPEHYSKRWRRERMTQMHGAVFQALQVSGGCGSRAAWRLSGIALAVLQACWQDGNGST